MVISVSQVKSKKVLAPFETVEWCIVCVSAKHRYSIGRTLFVRKEIRELLCFFLEPSLPRVAWLKHRRLSARATLPKLGQ